MNKKKAWHAEKKTNKSQNRNDNENDETKYYNNEMCSKIFIRPNKLNMEISLKLTSFQLVKYS